MNSLKKTIRADAVIRESFDKGELEDALLWDKGAHCMPERSIGAVSVGDYDGDGFPDVYASRTTGPPLLYHNRGDGTFEDVSEASGIAAGMRHALGHTAAWIDTQNSGKLDLMVTSFASDRYYFFANNGNGTFTECAIERGLAVVPQKDWNKNFTVGQGIAVGDFDRDGYLGAYHSQPARVSRLTQRLFFSLDMFIGEWSEYLMRSYSHKQIVSHSALLRNRGATAPGHFVDETEDRIGLRQLVKKLNPKIKAELEEASAAIPGVYTFSPAFVDLDNDGWLDLAIAADFGSTKVLWNNEGTFVEGNHGACCDDENGMGSTFADLDEDGKLDWFVGSIHDFRSNDPLTAFGTTGNRLYHNDGNRSFSDWTDKAGVRRSFWSWGSAFLDYDNDGDQDLYIVNGMTLPESTVDDMWNISPNQLFENDGSAQFKDVAADTGLDDYENSRGVATFDFDADGDLDILLVTNAGAPMLFRNDGGHTNDWLRIRVLEAEGGRDSVGAVVLAQTDNSHPQRRTIGVGAHLMAQSEATAHFGLGPPVEGRTVEVTITWPSKVGAESVTLVIRDVSANVGLTVIKPAISGTVEAASLAQCADCVAGVPSAAAMAAIASVWPEQWVPAVTIGDAAADGNSQMPKLPAQLAQELTGPLVQAIELLVAEDMPESPVRTADGKGNHPSDFGAAFTPLLRKAESNGYADGKSEVGGPLRPSARRISNVLFTQQGKIPSKSRLSEVNLHFGQLLAHDTDHTTPIPNQQVEESFPIPVDSDDLVFDPNSTGHEVIRFRRSIYKTGPSGIREQINKVTSFVDASSVYGSDAAREDALRSHENGRLRVSAGNLLPLNKAGLQNDNPLARHVRSLFVSGDSRVNIQPGLTAMHTVWHREHNWLAAQVKEAMVSAGTLPLNETDADERIFQLAKKLLIAEFQIVSYSEYLPSIVGEAAMPPYAGYKADVNPAVCTEFSTAAFRFGHSQVTDHFSFLGSDGVPIQKTDTPILKVALKDFYFLPTKIMLSGGIDGLIRQMIFEVAEEIDTHAVDGIRNMLFGERHAGGSDLIATNIQRGRDHGVPDYNTMRKAYGLAPIAAFNEISSSVAVTEKLESLYRSVDDIDAFVGGLAEDHVPGASVGPLFQTALVEQFARTRDGDRFWFERPISEGGLGPEIASLLTSATTMGGIIARNINLQIGVLEVLEAAKDGGANDRVLAVSMSKNNVMFAPENQYLWLGGCETDRDCPSGSFCADESGWEEPPENSHWSLWCLPCSNCRDWLTAPNRPDDFKCLNQCGLGGGKKKKKKKRTSQKTEL